MCLLRHGEHVPQSQGSGKETFDLLREVLERPRGPARASEVFAALA